MHVEEDGKRTPAASRLSLPKLLAGLYGGNFTSIGTIYAIDWVADGTCINDYSAM